MNEENIVTTEHQETAQEFVENNEIHDEQQHENHLEEQQTQEHELGDDEKPKFSQKDMGKARKEEREKVRRQYEMKQQALLAQQNAQNIPAQPSQNHIYDPIMQEWVDKSSPEGRLLVRDERKKQLEAQQRQIQENMSLQEKIMQGQEKYDDFEDSIQFFLSKGTDPMAEALKATHSPADVVNYLHKHPEEMKRISSLHPIKQITEVALLEQKINPPRKLVSNAATPIKPVGSSKSTVARREDMSFEQIRDKYLEENKRRLKQRMRR